MFKKSYQIRDVETALSADSIVYKLKNGELYSVNNKPIKVSDDVFSYSTKNGDVFFQKENLSNLIRMSLTDLSTVNVEGTFSLRGAFFVGNKQIYVLGKSEGKKVVYVLDINSLKVQSKIDYGCFPFISTSKGCICKIKSGLQYVDTSLQQAFWSYSFPEGEKVAGNIFLYESVLVVPSVAGQAPDNKDYLYGINVESGELLWKRDGSFQYYQLVKSSGLLYGFAHGLYEVTDIESGEKLVDKKLINDLWVSQHMNSIGDGGLYFVGGTHTNMGMFISKFGKINTETHEIEFIQKLDVAEGVKADPPIYHKGKLYIKDSLDTLHVYEQE
ncbi:MAG: hypothetical protein RIC30_20300 [Marinoscillum sp.]|uniref:hypothetical protein n=1 Tax=Marinoscillum sp. TaxID=2024838 RepID=UPI0032FF7D01